MSNNIKTDDKSNSESKESFCGACLAVPMALAGAGAAGVGAKGNGEHKKMKQILLWGGLSITVISIIIAIYFLSRCKDCR